MKCIFGGAIAGRSPMACAVCGCTESSPCLGGAEWPGDPICRIVTDPALLAPGDCCHWVVRGPIWICSAHTVREVEEAVEAIDDYRYLSESGVLAQILRAIREQQP